jgi:hypothetical protein
VKQRIIFGLAVLCCAAAAQPEAVSEAQRTEPPSWASLFDSPPEYGKPHTWWHWVNGHVTKDGITKDLEAMKAAGIGGFYQFFARSGTVQPPPGFEVVFDTEEYWKLVKHTLSEASRLGLTAGFHNCPGFSSTGGPWVQPEDAMKQFAWTETRINGGRQVSAPLRRPAPERPFYKDIAVLAVPETDDKGDLLIVNRPSLQSGGRAISLDKIINGDFEVGENLVDGALEVVFDHEVTVSSIGIATRSWQHSAYTLRIEASSDGTSFSEPRTLDVKTHGGPELMGIGTGTIKPLSGKIFRLSIEVSGKRVTSRVPLTWLALRGGPMLDNLGSLASYGTPSPRNAGQFPDGHAAPSGKYLGVNDILDVSRFMDAEGVLRWEAPPGNWTVLRTGYVNQWKKNRPSTPEAEGLEVDKFSKDALRRYFDAYPGRWVELAEKLPNNPLKYVLIDSYEAGPQNWGKELPAAFVHDNRYEIGPWLVSLTGRILESPLETERFLWEFRRTIGRLYTENYFAEYRRLCNEHGMEFVFQTTGPNCGNRMENGYVVDQAWTESWVHDHKQFKPFVLRTSAHSDGRTTVVPAETFTSWPDIESWQLHPGNLKPHADRNFVSGVNRVVYHTYVHQPFPDPFPGMSFVGMHNDRGNSWFSLSSGWNAYLARAQALLQMSEPFNDMLVLQPAGMPGDISQPSSDGYGQALCGISRLADARVEGKEAVLPALVSGLVVPYRIRENALRFRLLVLPARYTQIEPEDAERLAELVEAGVPLYGKPFTTTPARLGNSAEAENRVKRAAARIWQGGHAHVFKNGTPQDALAKIGITPDFQFETKEGSGAGVYSIRRESEEGSLYFIAGSERDGVRGRARFRRAAPAVQLWDPVSGLRTSAATRVLPDGRTEVDLDLPPFGSLFVMFFDKLAPRPHDLWLMNPPADSSSLGLTGPWNVAFDPKRGGPGKVQFEQLTDWSTHNDDRIKFYSGTAVYSKEFDVSADWVTRYGKRAVLEFDQVEVIAEVELNGIELGSVWTPPYRLQMGKALKAGKNTLSVKVANRLVNRMIGDEHLPADTEYTSDGRLVSWPEWFVKGDPRPTKRVTLGGDRPWKKKDPLLPSGLIGEVRIRTADYPK